MRKTINFEVTDMNALEAAFPQFIITETRKGVDRSKIRHALHAGIEVPGVAVIQDVPPFLQKAEEAKKRPVGQHENESKN